MGKECQTTKHRFPCNTEFHTVIPVLSQSEEILHKTLFVENLQLRCHELIWRLQLYKVTQGDIQYLPANNFLIPKLPGDGFLFL